MKARQLLQEAVHKPETLRVVFAAFDLAWAAMEKDYPAPATSRDDERHRLASMMLSFVTEDTRDPVKLKDLTLKALRRSSA